jgi:endonuclease/exonuclease/phosphatase (EEP) superfamily protein YafD
LQPARSVAISLFIALLGLVAATSGLAILGDSFWLGDMLAFFRPHLGALSALLVVFALALRRFLPVVAALTILGFNAYPLLVPNVTMAQPATTANLRFMSANVLFDNRSKELFRESVATIAPDVIVTQEARYEWPAALRDLPGYPYVAGPDVLWWNGNIVVSRFPLRARLVEDMPPAGGPIGGAQALRVEIAAPQAERPVVLYAIHAPTPRTEAGWHARNEYLKTLAMRIAAEPPEVNVIVAGDWNTPVWSTTFKRFFDATGMLATERSAWPSPTRLFSDFGAPAFLGTPIDHIAVSDSIGVKAFFTGPDFGSDHLPVVADLNIP